MSALDAFTKSVKRVGLWETVSQIPKFVVYRMKVARANAAILRMEELDGFDREHGTDTSGLIEIFELPDVTPEQIECFARYRATRPTMIRRLIEALELPYERFTFVDVGCGKGRPVVIAATYPFERVVGIEFSRELCRIAESNVRVTAGRPERRCERVDVICTDARDAELPTDDLVLFFYEPFTPPILTAFLERLRRSLDEAPRRVVIVSIDGGGTRPPLRPVFARTPWLRLVQEIPLGDASMVDAPGQSASVFEHVAS
jgi:SAM-dependent methyltransferase